MEPPILLTPRLTLRPLQPEDAPQLLTLRSNEEVNQYLNRPPTTTLQQAQAFIKNIQTQTQDTQRYYWAITLKTNPDTLIGAICLFNITQKNKTAELGYELLPTHHGKGYMTEAIQTVISFAFNTLHLTTITAFPHPNNQKSIKLLQNYHFQIDETHQFSTPATTNEYTPYYLKHP